MLDAPIIIQGESQGVICLEHVGPPRVWSQDEQNFAGSLADLVAMLMLSRERKQAEEALRTSQETFAAFMRHLPGYAYLKNEMRHYEFINEQLEAFFDKPRQDCLGQTFEQILSIPEAEEIRRHDEKVLTSREPLVAEESVPTGQKIRTFLSTRFPILRQDKPLMLGGISLDITEQKQLEAQLRQAQKMEAVGQLAGGVAHDFNNLLQVINGYAEMALEDLNEQHPARVCVEEIAGSGQRAALLVAQLLAFSRRQVIQPDNLDLNEIIAALLKMLTRMLGEHVQVEFLPGHQLGTVFADRAQIEQVLMNLCINARDAIREDTGRLTLETENVRFDQEYCENHSWARPGRYVLLSVTDTGSGMAPEVLEHIWEPFFTTKEVGKGTGLGLSTVYGIVRQHEGMVNVYSEPGRGTTFKVYLPLVERPAASVGTKVEAPARGGHETILVAEDNPTVRALIRLLLEKAGYRVLLASDGNEALAMGEKHGENIDLALLDVVMPGLGGRAVYETLHQKFPQIRFLFASGYSMNGVHTNFVLDEGFDLLQKPFESRTLLSKVRNTLDQPRPPQS